jgi:hypothetical protein
MGQEGHRIFARGLLEVWDRQMSDGSVVVGVFNRDTPYRGLTAASYSLPLSLIGISSPRKIRDVWRHEDIQVIDKHIAMIVPGHGTAIYRIFPQKP